MIELIKQIEANGHTYMAGGNLYYDISTYEDYGKGWLVNDEKTFEELGKDEVKLEYLERCYKSMRRREQMGKEMEVDTNNEKYK